MAHGAASEALLADRLIRPADAREALRLSPRSLNKLDEQGILPKVRIPSLGLVRYRLSDVEKLIRQGTRSPSRSQP